MSSNPTTDDVKEILKGTPLDVPALLRACAVAEQRFLEEQSLAPAGSSASAANVAPVADVYAVHLCALLLHYGARNGNPEAMALWYRTPESLKIISSLRDLWACGKQLLARDWAKFFASSHSLRPSPLVRVAVEALVHEVRARGVQRIARCYTSVDRETLCANLGMPDSEVSQFCASLGWREDAATGLITPTGSANFISEKSPASLGASASLLHANAQLEQLSMHVAHLEESIVLKP